MVPTCNNRLLLPTSLVQSWSGVWGWHGISMYTSYNIQVAKTKDAEDADGQGDCTLHEHMGMGAAVCTQVQHRGAP